MSRDVFMGHTIISLVCAFVYIDKTLKPFFACLKTERDTWCAYLEEMADCHERAESNKG